VAPFVVTDRDREWFLRCRRAWDWGAGARRGLEPTGGARPDGMAQAVSDALAVYYFPGMWTWERSIVAPLVAAALDRHPPASTAGLVDLLAEYGMWAPPLDTFTPVRVVADIDVAVPDPVIPGHSLATEDGDAVRYRDRVAAVVVDDGDERCWLLDHRMVTRWSEPDELTLRERAVLACWAFHEFELSMPVAGVLHNEVRVSPPAFRRTAVEHSPAEQATAAARLGRTVMAMLESPAAPEPNPDWEHCARCVFRSPCIARMLGDEARSDSLLAGGYRRREDDGLEEGRLGGVSWSVGRGAAPFGSRRPR
jgi:hypothetical protein